MLEENIGALKYWLVFVLLASACHRSDVWGKMRQGDFDIVSRGTYHGRPKYLPHPGVFEERVTSYRSVIEKNKDILPNITRKFFLVPGRLYYRYKFVSFDLENNALILRYFAPIAGHNLYAGYQIQFVFDVSTDKLLQIFTSEVPLE